MQRQSFLWRFFAGYAALVFLLLVILSVFVLPGIRRSFERDVQNSLQAQAALLRELARPHLRLLDASGLQSRAEILGHPTVRSLEIEIRSLGEAAGTVRYTVVRPDGLVLVDSHEDAGSLENHSARPELREARLGGEGMAKRYSRTLQVDMMYVAQIVAENGRAVGLARTAEPLDAIDARIDRLRMQFLGGAMLGLFLALLVGAWLARRITGPLRDVTAAVESMSRGEYGRRIHVDSRDEVGTLANAFNRMGEQLQGHLDIIQADRNKILAILAAMKEGVIAVDHDEYVLHMNLAAGAMLGVNPSDAIGHHVWEVVRVSDVCTVITETIRSGEAQIAESRIVAPRRDRIVELQSSVLQDTERDGAAGAVLVLHDVSEIRRLEGVRTDFVSNVSHELKTPLTAITGLVESMIEDEAMDAETRHRFLGRVQAQSRRLIDLVKDLLTLARAERQDSPPERSNFDLRVVLDASLNAVRPVAEDKKLDLKAELGSSVLSVHADEESLRQIFDNLLSNAVRYTPAGGSVAVRAWTEDGSHWAEVADTGPGIEPQHQERIFERFYRVDTARSRELGGTGLGLSIVKHRVLGLGGEVEVESETGAGSRFRVRLPISDRS